MTALRRLDDALFGAESAARLALVQVGFTVVIGLRIALSPYRELTTTPDVLFRPVALLGWLHHMPPETAIVVLQLMGVAAAVAALALRDRTRAPFVIAWACLLVLAGLRGSRGKILHNDLLLLWSAVPLLLAPLGARWGDPEVRRRYGWPVRSSMAIAAVVYGLAGYHKLVSTGPRWALGDNIRYVLLWGHPANGAIGHVATWVANHSIAYHAVGITMLAVELTFPLVLVWRRAQPWYALGAVSLHVATFLFLDLDYWAWAAVAALLFVDWPGVAARATRSTPVRQPVLR